MQAYETLAKGVERDKALARRVAESARRIGSFKKRRGAFLRPSKQPSLAMIQKLTRALWEFGEQVRLEPLSRKNDRRQRT